MLEQPTRTRLPSVIAVAAAGLIVAACGPNASPAPAARPTVNSQTSVTQSSGDPAPTPSSATAAQPPTAVARPTQVTPTSAAPVATAASDVRLVLDATSTQASYHAQEQLVGRSVGSEAVGTSNAVSGTLVLGQDGSVKSDQSQIQVDLRQLTSDESRRDNFIKGQTLQTTQYPTATFVPRSVQGLATPLPSSGQSTFQLGGDLTVHGVTKPVTWQVTAQFSDTGVSGNATTNVNISDFGMTPPRAGPVLSIEDGLTLEMVFTANREA